MRRFQFPTLLSAFLTLLNDRLSESIFLPLLPLLLKDFISSGTTLGLLSGTYALSQFTVAPLIGALSDRFGRKPVISLCVMGSVLGMGLFATTLSLPWQQIWPGAAAAGLPVAFLFVARIIDGASGGTAATATAVLADITTPENRARAFGLIGVAFGLGFALGPGLGGLLGDINKSLPAWAATGFALINLIVVLELLPETHSLKARKQLPRKRELNPITLLRRVFSRPDVRRLSIAFFGFFMTFNGFTNVLSLYLINNFNWTGGMLGAAFALVGVIAMVVQGGLIGPLVKRFGELRLTLFGLALLMVGCLLIPLATPITSIPVVYTAVSLLAVGTGLVTPCLRTLVSRRLDHDGQGAALGGLQGLQSLGTFLGASAAGFSYDKLGPTSPFWFGGMMLVGVALLVAGGLPKRAQVQQG
ncbi:MAG: MFS transporter [Synechococcus sp. TMED187]|nr:MAG: MFS transporter [Synechococcus sp. TMED187]RZO11861.1 MAG: MFS transporter [Synechococcus sp. MED-G135]